MRFLKFLTVTAIALYAIALSVLWTQQRHLLFFATTEQVSPDAAGFRDARTLTLTTPDHERLIAWYRPPQPGQPLILYFHGNANNLGGDARRLEALATGGYGILAVDYRGYGGSTGVPSEEGLLADAETTLAKATELGFGPQNTVLYGHSLGTGVAVAMAARHEVAALILEAPFTSAVAVAQARYWIFPVGALMLDPFHSDERIKSVHAPLLVIHGTADGTIPVRFGEKLFALANEPKQFVAISEGGHMLMLAPGVSEQIHQWLAAALAKTAGAN